MSAGSEVLFVTAVIPATTEVIPPTFGFFPDDFKCYTAKLEPGEEPQMRRVRFRTLGCYPLTGAVESDADTVPKMIEEMLLDPTSERQGRVIDHDEAASMEKKKREGYF